MYNDVSVFFSRVNYFGNEKPIELIENGLVFLSRNMLLKGTTKSVTTINYIQIKLIHILFLQIA